MAHETGHFLGLFHPVETDYDLFDAIDDTSECSLRTECEDLLGSNLMFPYPVCTFASCVTQDQLTSGQSDVLQQNVGVD